MRPGILRPMVNFLNMLKSMIQSTLVKMRKMTTSLSSMKSVGMKILKIFKNKETAFLKSSHLCCMKNFILRKPLLYV
ncbi:hypothetical protein TNCT_152851 [Trichonephila clavata]|uniref:Uncharacterized protein n=1 Tax=Trichonephila clavata TaxID=2740835 RepID=A0A8X6L9V4_TRICU|nr:hypothetical protein TNCT_152851 [Trichonephila clavata]